MLGTGRAVLKVGRAVGSLVSALVGMLWELAAVAELPAQGDRSVQDSDLIGDYNFRTQEFDSGTDPAGWYEDEP